MRLVAQLLVIKKTEIKLIGYVYIDYDHG